MAGAKVFILFVLISTLNIIVKCDERVPTKIDEILKGQSLFYGAVATAAEGLQDTLCSRQMAMTAEGVINKNRWALRMLDSSGVPESSLHWGNTFWLGNKVQCEATMNNKSLDLDPQYGPVTIETEESIPPFPVSYYAAYVNQNSTIQSITHVAGEFRLIIGLCFPTTCEGPELTSILQKYLDLKILYHQKLNDMIMEIEGVKKIEDNYDWLWEASTVTLIIYTIIILSLIIVGTIYDLAIYQPLLENQENAIYSDSKKNDGQTSFDPKTITPPKINYAFKVLRCFSAYTNNTFILSTKSTDDSIRCLQGMKFFSMIYIIVGHVVYFLQIFFKNKAYTFYIGNDFITQIFFTSHFSVDTFYCIGGYLMAYLLLKACSENKKKPNLLNRLVFLVYITFRRYIRILPSYFVMILISIVILKWRINAMPYWVIERDDITCSKYWWRNILFINTWSGLDERCLTWSWYLSNDMQFFIICAALVLLSTVYFKTAVLLTSMVFLGSISLTAYLVQVEEYLPTLNGFYLKRNTFYDPPWIRINPYIVGTVAGYIVFRLKKKLHINKHILRLIWVAWTIICLCQMTAYSTLIDDVTVSMVYVSLSRIVWAISSAWVIIACETGNGGIMNSLLSVKAFIPLSRMAFWVFLASPLTMFFMLSFSQTPIEATVSSNAAMTPGFILWAFMLSYIFTIVYESPWTALIKLLTEKGPKKSLKNEEKLLKNKDKKVHKKVKSS